MFPTPFVLKLVLSWKHCFLAPLSVVTVFSTTALLPTRLEVGLVSYLFLIAIFRRLSLFLLTRPLPRFWIHDHAFVPRYSHLCTFLSLRLSTSESLSCSSVLSTPVVLQPIVSQFAAPLSSLKLVYPTLATQSHVHRAELSMCDVISEQWGQELTPQYSLPTATALLAWVSRKK